MKESWKPVFAMVLKDVVGIIFYVLFIFNLAESAWRQDLIQLAGIGYTVFIIANSIDAFRYGD